jgi:hypothetical protein
VGSEAGRRAACTAAQLARHLRVSWRCGRYAFAAVYLKKTFEKKREQLRHRHILRSGLLGDDYHLIQAGEEKALF